MTDLLTETRDDGVAVVTLNRPAKRNALSLDLRREVAAAFRALGSDEAVGVVVITGAPPAFCSGMDRTQFGGDDANRRALYDTTQELFGALRDCAVPTIAAVNGAALGGGFALAAHCDLRLASPDAVFGSPEIGFGVPPSYGSIARVVAPQVARELALTGRSVDAAEALRLGIVLGVHDDVVAEAGALGARIAAHGPRVLRMVKRQIVAQDPEAEEMAMFRDALFGSTTKGHV